MFSYALYLYLLIIFPITTTAATTPAYTATDFILLNCGNSSTSNDTSGRSWDGDERSKYVPSNAASISSGARASSMHTSVYEVPYQTARVFHSPFTYTFPVVTGPKFLRLYFYPNIYSHFNTSQSFFSVTANDFTLFTNFSAFLQSQYSNQDSFMKEFVINIQENQRVLILTVTPNPNCFAFINGIEIVSMPDTLYFRGNDVPIKFVNELYYLQNSTALETLYRLNVGGSHVEIQNDSGPKHGMFREWFSDDDYMLYDVPEFYTPYRDKAQINYTAETPPYSAPPIVYTSARVIGNYRSLEWAFPVDSGFHYLLRLHFCEIMLDVSAQNPREFTVSIYYKLLEYGADDMYLTGRPDTPIFRDYIAWIPDVGGRGKQNLRLSLLPSHDSTPPYYKALLNGLEIFKLSDSNRSLAAANPVLTSHPAVSGIQGRKNHKTSVSSALYASLGSAIGLLAVVAAVSFLILRWRSKVEDTTKTSWAPLSTASTSTTTPSGSGFSIPSHLCSYFTIDDIKSATRNFDSNSIIGKGGFGNVYKGLVNRGFTTTVAIKRLHPSSNQGAREFLTEIEMLSKLRHLHLVSLTGYCDDGDEMILVYDYMAHGTLRDHLYNSDNPPLKWEQRLQICLGAAKGLHFLHNGAQHAIIHRDVKSTNILLDEAWVAKISDFGLSKMGQANDSFTHISTNVKGTFGYLDPKYMSSHQLTRKSDVYAFGVVLFEVLSGRAAVDITLDEEQHSLASWARYCIRKGEVDRLIDPNLLGQISPACFKVYAGIAGRCVHIQPLERPTMADVVMGLELALTLQQTTDSAQQKEDDANDQSNEVISMDGITATIEYSPSSSIRNSQSEG